MLDLQCCVSLSYVAKWLIYTHTALQIPLLYRSPQNAQ